MSAQVGIWSFTIRYAQLHVAGTTEQQAADYLLTSLAVFIAGRFVTTGIIRLNILRVHTILGIYAIAACALSVLAVLSRNAFGLWCIVSISFFMSLMFPTIFAVALGCLDRNDVKLASSFLVMAIVGGAVITAIMGLLSDMFGIALAFIVPAICFAGVAVFAFLVAPSAEVPAEAPKGDKCECEDNDDVVSVASQEAIFAL
jgi:FHS family L-fucose permease-like MFS transporter